LWDPWTEQEFTAFSMSKVGAVHHTTWV